MALNRVRCKWENFAGAPGYSSFYFDSAATPPLAALTTFWGALQTLVPVGTTFTVPNSGDTINESDGKITGSWTGPVQTPVVAAGGGTSYVGSAGGVILWKTADPIDGRRPIGKTYIVPMTTTRFDTGGNVASVEVTKMLNAALALVTAGGAAFKVWSRPKYNTKVDPPQLIHGGSAVTIIGATVPTIAAVMRTRRR